MGARVPCPFVARREVVEGSADLVRQAPEFAAIVAAVGPCELRSGRRQRTHFAELARAICYQQLAGAAARSIHGRFAARFDGEPTAEAVLAAPEADLRLCWEQSPEVQHFDLSPSEGDYWRCALTAQAGVDLRPKVFEEVLRRGWALRELTRNRATLEDIFVRVTRSRQEDDEEF